MKPRRGKVKERRTLSSASCDENQLKRLWRKQDGRPLTPICLGHSTALCAYFIPLLCFFFGVGLARPIHHVSGAKSGGSICQCPNTTNMQLWWCWRGSCYSAASTGSNPACQGSWLKAWITIRRAVFSTHTHTETYAHAVFQQKCSQNITTGRSHTSWSTFFFFFLEKSHPTSL